MLINPFDIAIITYLSAPTAPQAAKDLAKEYLDKVRRTGLYPVEVAITKAASWSPYKWQPLDAASELHVLAARRIQHELYAAQRLTGDPAITILSVTTR